MATVELNVDAIFKVCEELLGRIKMPYTTICIVGSVERVWDNDEKEKVKDFIRDLVTNLEVKFNCIFISGESPKGGVDIWTKEICNDLGVTYKGYPPLEHSWHYYKKRNKLMAEACDILIRVFNARSKTYGSGWAADRAEELGKKVLRVKVW